MYDLRTARGNNMLHTMFIVIAVRLTGGPQFCTSMSETKGMFRLKVRMVRQC